jgi:isopenicillin-N N-acyltransferase like protein
MYPHILVEGGPRQRGRQYGEQARERVRLSIDAYREVFSQYAGWGWPRVCDEAKKFERPIAAYCERYLEEIRGIAEGAAVDELDVLAINVRTEVMFAAKARDAAASMRRFHECSSFATLPPAEPGGRTLLGQNWDWLLHTFDTVVVLEARQDDGPDFVTVVEAGLLAKTGLNSSGVGLCTNALVTDADLGTPGVPYHVVLRAILDSETISDALVSLQRGSRSSSANYLIAHEDGVALDVEAAPGDFSRLFFLYADDGVLLHTNHFIGGGFDGRDVSVWAMPNSPVRLARLRDLVASQRGQLSEETWEQILADHATYPLGICSHPDPRITDLECGATVASVIMDLGERRVWLADGQPCSTPYRQLDYQDFLSRRSSLLPAA